MPTITVEQTVAAPPDVVFDVLTDHRGYAAISPIRGSDLEREGDPAPNGLGAIRTLRLAPGPPLREEITAFDRPRHYAYRLLSGAPVKDHTADVTFSDVGGKTRVVYRIETTPKVPGLVAPAIVAVLRRGTKLLLAGAAREAERRAGSGRAAS
jgi:uncharacterized protein YndB with AHSA1/START domain